MEENDSNTGLVLAETSKETHQDRLELLLAENPHKSFAVALFLVQLRLALQTDRTDSSSIDDVAPTGKVKIFVHNVDPSI
ncbi:tol protein [Fusarium fujikuroi]|nr:tol protein [Fusarium fujikuroi]